MIEVSCILFVFGVCISRFLSMKNVGLDRGKFLFFMWGVWGIFGIGWEM